jgi:hypothetical protein
MASFGQKKQLRSTLFPSFQKLSKKGWGPDLLKSAEDFFFLSLVDVIMY